MANFREKNRSAAYHTALAEIDQNAKRQFEMLTDATIYNTVREYILADKNHNGRIDTAAEAADSLAVNDYLAFPVKDELSAACNRDDSPEVQRLAKHVLQNSLGTYNAIAEKGSNPIIADRNEFLAEIERLLPREKTIADLQTKYPGLSFAEAESLYVSKFFFASGLITSTQQTLMENPDNLSPERIPDADEIVLPSTPEICKIITSQER